MANKKAIRKWVKALRSGDYNQTHSKLKGYSGFCCLGVLCDVSPKGGWNEGVYHCGGAEHLVLPPGVVTWAELPDNNPELLNPDFDKLPPDDDENWQYMSAAELNDNMEWDFNQLADAIEATFL